MNKLSGVEVTAVVGLMPKLSIVIVSTWLAETEVGSVKLRVLPVSKDDEGVMEAPSRVTDSESE